MIRIDWHRVLACILDAIANRFADAWMWCGKAASELREQSWELREGKQSRARAGVLQKARERFDVN